MRTGWEAARWEVLPVTLKPELPGGVRGARWGQLCTRDGPLPLLSCIRERSERGSQNRRVWEFRSVLSLDQWELRGWGPVSGSSEQGWSSQWSHVLWSFIAFFHFQDGKRCCVYTKKGRESVPQSSPQRKVQTPKGETLNTTNMQSFLHKKCRVLDYQQGSHSEVCVCVCVT